MSSEKRDEIITTIKTALAKKRLSALHIYRMADPEDANSVSVITLKQVFLSMIPGLQPDTVFALLKILDANRNGFVDKEEFELVFLKDKNDLEDIKDDDSRIEYKQSEQSIHNKSQRLDESMHEDSQLGNNDSVIDEVKTPRGGVTPRDLASDAQHYSGSLNLDSDDPSQVARSIGKEMLDNMVHPESVFEGLDDENQGLVALQRLVRTMKEYLPNVHPAILFKCAKYMDSDKDGFIKKGDYLAALGGRPVSNQSESPRGDSRPAIAPASSKIGSQPSQPGMGPGGAGSNDLTGKLGQEAPTLSDRQFYEKVRALKDLIRANSVAIDCIFEGEEIPTALLANRLNTALPDFPRQSIRQILKYVDVENNGLIRRDEFDLMIGYDNNKAELDESRLVIPI